MPDFQLKPPELRYPTGTNDKSLLGDLTLKLDDAPFTSSKVGWVGLTRSGQTRYLDFRLEQKVEHMVHSACMNLALPLASGSSGPFGSNFPMTAPAPSILGPFAPYLKLAAQALNNWGQSKYLATPPGYDRDDSGSPALKLRGAEKSVSGLTVDMCDIAIIGRQLPFCNKNPVHLLFQLNPGGTLGRMLTGDAKKGEGGVFPGFGLKYDLGGGWELNYVHGTDAQNLKHTFITVGFPW